MIKKITTSALGLLNTIANWTICHRKNTSHDRCTAQVALRRNSPLWFALCGLDCFWSTAFRRGSSFSANLVAWLQSFCAHTRAHTGWMRRGDAKRNCTSKVWYYLPIGLVLVPLQHSTWQVGNEFDEIWLFGGNQRLHCCFLLMAIATECSRFCRWNMM